VTFLAALSFIPAAFAGQGAASYLDFNGTTAGFGTAATTSESALNWSTSAAGTAATTARPSGTQLTIGAQASDFLDVAPETFNINLDGGGNLQGVLINSTNVNVTFTGSANTHNNSGPNTWTVTNFSTLIVNDTRQAFDSASTVKGLNWNNVAVTFQGGGTITFQTPMACNTASAIQTEAMLPTGVINLQNAAISTTCSYKGGFTLTSGTLNFASAGSAYAFSGLTNGQFLAINGGVIDNTSGSPIVLQTGTLSGASGGLYSLGGPLTFPGSSSLDLGTSGMTNKGNNTITVNANTLAIGGVISGPGNGITKLGNGMLLLYGADTYSGTTLVEAGTLALTNGGSLANSPLVVSNSSLDVTGLSAATTLISLGMTNSTLNVAGLQNSTNILTAALAVGGTANTVNVSKLPFVASFPTTFHLIKASSVIGSLNYTLGTLPPTPAYQAYISNNVANNSVDLVITNGPTANSLKWTGINALTTLPDGTWDVANTETWQVGVVATNFNQNDIVTFDDSATGLTAVNVTGGESPSVLTVSNNTKSYIFTNSGIGDSILGGLTLNKFGTGSLLLQENNDSFTGGINVNAGSVILDQLSSSVQGGAIVSPGALLQLGNNDTAGVLPVGIIMVNGTLLFNQTNNLTVANTIDGNGVVEQFTTNVLTLSGTSTGNWSVVITNSVLQAANNTALGSIPGGSITVTNGGTFDLGANTTQNNANFGNKQFNVSGAGVDGNGVIVNNGSVQQQDAFQNVILVGDATIGGADRWDLRGGTPLLDLAGHTLTKTNANQVTVVSGHITSGNIIIQQGLISFEVAPVFDPSAGTITVNSGAYVGQYRDILNSFTRSIVLNGGGTTNLSGANTNAFLDAPILLTADSSLNTGAGTEYFNNVISDGGSGFGLTEIGIGTNLLAGTNTYSGDTVIAGIGMLGGTLGLTNHGSIANSPFIVVTNGSIFNISGLAVPFTGANTLILGDDVQGAGTLIAGNTVITNFNSITLSNATISLAITNPTPTTPNITVTNLNLGDGSVGSTIAVTALPQLMSPGQYPLIKYVNVTGTYNMNIGQVPAGFAASLVNNTGNHSIDLQVTAVPTGVWSAGGNPDFNWSNAANWRGTALTGNDPLLFMGTIGLNNTNDTGSETAQGITFAPGSGAFVLNGNPVTLSGGITNSTANTDTINLGLSFSAPQVFTAGNGTLILGGGLTNAATGNTNLLTLVGTGILTNLIGNPNANTNTLLLNSAGTTCSVMDNASSIAVSVPWVLNNNNGTFNFGNATSAPRLSLTTLNGSPQDNQVGSVTNETSVFNMSNGTFTTTARLNTGLATNAVGIINQYGGTMTIGNQFQGANGSGGSSAVNISAGVMNIGSAANPASPFYVASRGPGTVTVGGTGVLNCGTLDVSRSINSSINGTVNLNSGGTIVASLVSTATSSSSSGSTGSTGTFNFNGGTLRAYTNAVMLFSNSPASPLVPLSAVVKAGGAVIDSSTNTIIFVEGLNTDPSLGGAQDGGLTKIGNGTLILNQPNTYNGNTVISAGTLALFGAGLIADTTNIVIAANATFDVSAATFALGSSQVISNSGSTALIGGNADLSNGKLSLTYAGVPSLSSTNGTLTLAGTTGLRINNTGAALTAGTYTIITNTTGGAVAGTVPSSFAVTGGGIAGGTTASLQISGSALNLVVATSATPPPPKIQHITFSGGNIIITGTNNNGAGGTYRVLTSMSLTLPLSSWGVFTNGTFDSNGNFAVTNAISGNGPRLFYIIQVP
jgi:autotransporter-associated beta strand protein